MKQLEAPRKYPASKLGVIFAKQQSPHFQSPLSVLVLSMELAILLLVPSFREANFILCCHSLAELIPYFFANNNVNYEPWLPIHLRDMLTLEEKHPQVAQEFCSGKFVVHKSCCEFSAMAIDQAHDRGATGTSLMIHQHWEDGCSWPWSQPLSSTV